MERKSSSSSKSAMLTGDDQSRLALLESKVADQKKEIENREITIRAIQRNFEQLSGMCQADKETIQVLQKKLAEAEKRAVDEETKKMAAKYPKLRESFDVLNEKYLEAEQKLEKMDKQVKSAVSNADKAGEQMKAFARDLDTAKKALEESKKLLASANASSSAFDSKRVVLEKDVRELKESLKIAERGRTELEKSESGARADVSKLKAELMKATANSEKQIADLKAKINESENARLQGNKAGANAGAELGKTKDDLAKAKERSEKLEKQLSEMHKLLEKATSQAGAKGGELDAERTKATALQKQVSALEKDLSVAKQSMQELQKRVNASAGASADETAKLRDETAKLRVDFARAADKVQEQVEEISVLEKAVKEAQGTITGLKHSNQKLEEKVAHLHDQAEFWDSEGSKLKADLAKREAELEDKDAELRRYRKANSDLDQAAGAAVAASAELDRLTAAHKRELAEVRRDGDKAREELGGKERTLESTKKNNEVLEKKLKEASEELKGMRSGQEGVYQLHEQIDTLKGVVEKKDGNIARSEKIIQKLMGDVEEFKRKGAL